MFGLGTGEIMVILIVVLLIFGGKKIPELARGLGKGLREFQKAKDGFTASAEETVDNKTSTKTESE
jgi:sec-independent protein translocase protein TatA